MKNAAPRLRWLIPSLSDCLLAGLCLWLLVYSLGDGSAGVLQDVNTGLHIRTGEYILDHGEIPHRDLFGFSKPVSEWYAWEWLADLLFALAWRWSALSGVVMLTIGVIAVTVWISLRHMLARGANGLVALALLHVGIAVSSVHYLARPHIFTLAFMALAWRLIDDDRRSPGKTVWLLVPLTPIWVNLHVGFAGLIITLGMLSAGLLLERRWRTAARYGGLALACLGAATLNPKGVRLHFYMTEFFRAAWVRELIQDFQPPRFNSEGGLYLEVLLFTGIATAAALALRREFASALVVLAWSHAALSSVRHFGLFFLIAAPLAAQEITAVLKPFSDHVLMKLGRDHVPGLSRSSVWALVLWMAAAAAMAASGSPKHFPESRAPVALVDRHAGELAGSRVFTLDSWADYLIFRSYPRQRVFLDGRWDYYGPAIARDYRRLLNGETGWEQALERYHFDAALIPDRSTLAGLLRRSAGWQVTDQEGEVVFFRRATLNYPAVR